MSEGTKAVSKCIASLCIDTAAGEAIQRAACAGLISSVPVAGKLPRIYGTAARVPATAPVYLAGILEPICGEIFDLAGDVLRDEKKVALAPKHIMRAIRGNEKLSALSMRVLSHPVTENVHFPQSMIYQNDMSPETSSPNRANGAS